MDDDFDDHPDWDRFRVAQPGRLVPSGDPTKWGAQQLVVLTGAPALVLSDTMLAVSTRDAYSRSWALLGSLSMPAAFWLAGSNVIVKLIVTMGVGQAQITQEIVLFYGGAALGGLCYTQNFSQGGPYDFTILEPGGTQFQSYPFAAIGALIGQSISLRASYLAAGGGLGLPRTVTLSVIMTPFAAGEGL